jgi:hypothetical protein
MKSIPDVGGVGSLGTTVTKRTISPRQTAPVAADTRKIRGHSERLDWAWACVDE